MGGVSEVGLPIWARTVPYMSCAAINMLTIVSSPVPGRWGWSRGAGQAGALTDRLEQFGHDLGWSNRRLLLIVCEGYLRTMSTGSASAVAITDCCETPRW